MRWRRLARLGRSGRRVLSLIERRAVILLYHRIAEVPIDPHGLCVTPMHFAEQVDHLGCHYRVLRLRELRQALVTGEMPRGAVVLTFDDGYADNLYGAKPVLERADMPATCFMTSGYLGQDRLFWWDDLEQLLLASPSLPDTIECSLRERTYRWCLNAAAPETRSARRRCRPERRLPPALPTPRQVVHRDLWRLLQPLDSAERSAALAHLRAQAGAPVEPPSDRRVMTADEVRRLDAGGLVEVGAHTVTHPMLAHLPEEEQRAELCCSRAALEEVLGRPVTTFSYPFGGEAAVGAAAPRLAREIGFESACAVAARPVSRGADLYRLPRFPVEDWDGDTFARRLRGFFRS